MYNRGNNMYTVASDTNTALKLLNQGFTVHDTMQDDAKKRGKKQPQHRSRDNNLDQSVSG